MAKSKCKLCGKQLKGGEGMYRKNDDGNVIKVCIDRESCRSRMRAKTIGLGASSWLTDKRKKSKT